MKWLLASLLLPSIAFAQQPAPPPGEQMDPQQFFEQSKRTMLPMMEKSLPAMQETKACLGKAEDEAAFKKCVAIMTDLEKEMQAKMGPVPGMPGGQPPQMKEPKEIEFNAENKKNMLMFLDRSIAVGSALQKCFSSSDTVEQMRSCMQAAKPKQ